MTKKWLPWILVSLFAIAIIKNIGQFEKLIETSAQGKIEWISAALILQVIFYAIYVLHYQAAFWVVDIKTKYKDLVNILFTAIFINMVTPSAGTAGAAYTAAQINRQGNSLSRSAAGVLLAGIVDFMVISIFAIASMIFLIYRHKLNIGIILGSLALAVIAGGMVGAVTLGRWQPKLLSRLLKSVKLIINFAGKKLLKRELINDERIKKIFDELKGTADSLAEHPQRLLRAFLIGMGSYVFNILSVWTLFSAFSQPINIFVLIVGFAMGMLFWTVTVTPQGIGTVEGAMILAYSSLGIPIETAALVTLVFRGMTLWLPVALGFIIYTRPGDGLRK